MTRLVRNPWLPHLRIEVAGPRRGQWYCKLRLPQSFNPTGWGETPTAAYYRWHAIIARDHPHILAYVATAAS